MRKYKTKAVRKAERWARRGVLTSTVKKFRSHLWFRQLVKAHGIIHAVRMTHDAQRSGSSWCPLTNLSCGSVVLWSATRYFDDWSDANYS